VKTRMIAKVQPNSPTVLGNVPHGVGPGCGIRSPARPSQDQRQVSLARDRIHAAP
jgi:hypothetical protein